MTPDGVRNAGALPSVALASFIFRFLSFLSFCLLFDPVFSALAFLAHGSPSLLSTRLTGMICFLCFPTPETTRFTRNGHRVGGWRSRTRVPECPPALGCPVELSPTGVRSHRAWSPHAVPRRGGGPRCPLPDGLGGLKVPTVDSRGYSRPWKQMASVPGASDSAECQVSSSGLSYALLSSR